MCVCVGEWMKEKVLLRVNDIHCTFITCNAKQLLFGSFENDKLLGPLSLTVNNVDAINWWQLKDTLLVHLFGETTKGQAGM